MMSLKNLSLNQREALTIFAFSMLSIPNVKLEMGNPGPMGYYTLGRIFEQPNKCLALAFSTSEPHSFGLTLTGEIIFYEKNSMLHSKMLPLTQRKNVKNLSVKP